MIEIVNHRRRSTRTADEDRALISQELSALEPDELLAVQEFLSLAADMAAASIQVLERSVYKSPPVSFYTFVTDPHYLGHVSIFPRIMRDLIELFDGEYQEVLWLGSIGWGKSFSATVALAYVLYLTSLLIDPCGAYKLSKGSQIFFVLVSVSAKQARRGLFNDLLAHLVESPYFNDIGFKHSKSRGEITLPGGIKVIASGANNKDIIGLNVFGGIQDETGFVGTAKRGQAKFNGVAWRIYNSIQRRMKSRYQSGGRLPGILFLISSATDMISFSEWRAAEAIRTNDPLIFVREYANWDTREGQFAKGRFRVYFGGSVARSRILGDDEPDPSRGEDDWVVEVPVDYRVDFEQDITSALQDLAGIATPAGSRFYVDQTKIDLAYQERRHPFTDFEWTEGEVGDFKWSQLCTHERIETSTGPQIRWRPRVNPDAPRWFHFDTSLKNDATGVCVMHVVDWVEIRRRNPETNETEPELMPVLYIDFMLRVVSNGTDEIQLASVRGLIYQLQAHGFQFCGGSTDSYQYADTHQQMELHGIPMQLISVDKTATPHSRLKQATMEGRVKGYYHPTIIEEAKTLERRDGGKVDHPQGGSKDVLDAAAGCAHALHDPSVLALPGIMQREQPTEPDDDSGGGYFRMHMG